MNIVYCPNATVGAVVVIDENESHHLQVLRMKAGDRVDIFDGKGNLYSGHIAFINKKETTVQIKELTKTAPMPAAGLHIAIAPTKNIERTEWFIEKATEIGIQNITPMICARSERREIRIDRLEKVLLSAAKQSLHLHLPTLNQPQPLQTFLKTNSHNNSKKFIAYCEEQTAYLQRSFTAGESIIVLIGPEGDFTPDEIAMAKASGFMPVSLGESRLRTETAGIMASAIFAMINN